MGTSNQIDIRYLETSEYDLWDQFVDGCKYGTIFHKSFWLLPISKPQHLKFDIAACFKGGKLVAGMAFTWKRKYGRIPVIQTPLKTPFFGPVISYSDTKYSSKIESQVQSTATALTNFLMSKFQLFQAQFPPSLTDIRPYVWNGFLPKVHYTYIGEIHEDSVPSENFEPDIKRRIKKALELDHRLIVDSSRENISFAWDLEQLSFKRQQFSITAFRKDDFISFVQKLVEKGSAEVFTITQNEDPVASVVMILDQSRGVAYYWMAGANKDYLSTGLNQLLIQLILEKYKASSFRWFDFVGADTDSIARYKSTFNFPLVAMYSVTKSRGLAKVGMMIKKVIR